MILPLWDLCKDKYLFNIHVLIKTEITITDDVNDKKLNVMHIKKKEILYKYSDYSKCENIWPYVFFYHRF